MHWYERLHITAVLPRMAEIFSFEVYSITLVVLRTSNLPLPEEHHRDNRLTGLFQQSPRLTLLHSAC